jgi:hypothetical protein
MYYGGLSATEMLAEDNDGNVTHTDIPPVTEKTPQFRDISIKNITCRGAMQALFLQGLPELNLENITLENIEIKADYGMVCTDASRITIKGLHLTSVNMPVLRFLNCTDINIEGLDVSGNGNPYIDIRGDKTKNINVRSVRPIDKESAVIGDEVEKGTVKIL